MRGDGIYLYIDDDYIYIYNLGKACRTTRSINKK